MGHDSFGDRHFLRIGILYSARVDDNRKKNRRIFCGRDALCQEGGEDDRKAVELGWLPCTSGI